MGTLALRSGMSSTQSALLSSPTEPCTILFKLRHIPTVGGPSIPGLSYLAAFNFLRNAKEVLSAGYEKVRAIFPSIDFSDLKALDSSRVDPSRLRS